VTIRPHAGPHQLAKPLKPASLTTSRRHGPALRVTMKILKFDSTRLALAACLSLLSAGSAWAGSTGHPQHDKAPANVSPAALPPIRIVSPQPAARVGPVVTVEFETPADLSKMTMSGAETSIHLHIDMDGVSIMPALADLKRVGTQRYRYTFDLPAQPGERSVAVYWSDARHKTIEASVRRVGVTVVAPGAKGTAKP